MNRFARFYFAGEKFDNGEEYSGFRFLFLGLILLLGALNSSLMLLSDYTGWNPIPSDDLQAMQFHTVVSLAFFVLLRGRKHLYLPISLAYGAVSLYVTTAALLFVPQDELRIIWFFLTIPAYYLLLGKIAGVAITLVSMLILGFANHFSLAPYSHNAVATGTAAMFYISAFFYFYSDRTLSFFTRMMQSQEALRYQATRDPLTGQLNARAYYEIVNGMIAVARRENSPYCVFFVDLDHFKAINDTYGHKVGDLVLARAAQTLRSSIRESDVLGRVGGEEFSVYLPGTNLAGAMVLAEKLRKAIEALRIEASPQAILQITASIGIAECQPSHHDIADIQRDADQAMYIAKQSGRNRVHCSTAA